MSVGLVVAFGVATIELLAHQLARQTATELGSATPAGWIAPVQWTAWLVTITAVGVSLHAAASGRRRRWAAAVTIALAAIVLLGASLACDDIGRQLQAVSD